MSSISFEYSQIGNPKGILKGISVEDPREKDPVEMCLPGKYLNRARLTEIDVPNCPAFMKQRCAAKWDKYCDVFYDSLGNENSLWDSNFKEKFLDDVTDSKFCRLDRSGEGSKNCMIQTQLFDPTLPNSPTIVTSVGNVVYSTGPLDPYEITQGCNKICDNLSSNIENEPLFKRCMENSSKDPCRSVIDSVCYAAANNKYSIKSDKLIEMCKTRKLNLDKLENSFIPTKPKNKELVKEGFSNSTSAGISLTVLIFVAVCIMVIYFKMRNRNRF